ncbi:formate/nitrite transporter family protein [Palleronia sp. LCG004]|uniref:formate/nitrite transporter family protein n=1 Tax=Palleronia sp. LCG004 TaxID=3079304 RepID=UPI0029437844|nr:formate/nitrite transporter family protein [Palleronia sp. LCG004]WOI56000.1 formate/nitrite transporter family protein [Palleronia sp. LCG004]
MAQAEDNLRRDNKETMAKTGRAEEKSVNRATRLTAPLIYEVVRRDGAEEMTRPKSSLVFSGLAAGVLISFSIITEAILRAYLPQDATWVPLVESFGYTAGFLLVILGRMQLFTENTITTVLPLMAHPCSEYLWLTCRLWMIVLAANVVGAFVAAGFIGYSGVFGPEVLSAVHAISEHATTMPAFEGFVKGMPAGVLIAAIVWMIPTQPQNPFFIIFFFTWLISAGDFTHIIAGSVEMAYMMLHHSLGIMDAIFGFFIPVFLGNVAGGTVVFTLITWGQVKEEVES